MCMDYRKLNEVTVKDAHPLPRIGQPMDALQEREFSGSMNWPAAIGKFLLHQKTDIRPRFALPMGDLTNA